MGVAPQAVNAPPVDRTLPPLATLLHREVRTEETRLAAVIGVEVEYEAYRARVRCYL